MRKILWSSVLAISLSAVPMLSAQSAEIVSKAQQALKDKGYDPGPVDGKMGPKTRSAIRSFQKKSDIPAKGDLSGRTLEGLGVKSEAGPEFSQAGATTKSSYKKGGKDIGEGAKDVGADLKHGHVVNAGKDLGKSVGEGAKKIGVGTGKAAKDTAKGVKDVVTGK
jgi:peptidoglycan hydrolase-like protein with peptidoglycan-binding domain